MTSKILIYLDRVAKAKSNFSIDEWKARPAPNKWSRQEILGHLVDSAFYNSQRFKDIKSQEGEYQVSRYKQDESVQQKEYNLDEWQNIFNKLDSHNKEIHITVKDFLPADLAKVVIDPDRVRHNAEWLIKDYIAHFEHHLTQIFGEQIIE